MVPHREFMKKHKLVKRIDWDSFVYDYYIFFNSSYVGNKVWNHIRHATDLNYRFTPNEYIKDTFYEET